MMLNAHLNNLRVEVEGWWYKKFYKAVKFVSSKQFPERCPSTGQQLCIRVLISSSTLNITGDYKLFNIYKSNDVKVALYCCLTYMSLITSEVGS